MAESDSCKIQEESPPSPPYQTPNSHLTAEIEERINPKLLRAIVNGDLMLFKSILGIEGGPIDTESIRESNGGNDALRRFACGEGEPIDTESIRESNGGNDALRRFACGEGEPIDTESIRESNGGNDALRRFACGGNTALHVVAGVMEKSRQIPKFTINFLIFFVAATVFYGIGFILIFLLFSYIIKNQVKKFVSVHFPRIPQKIYEKAKRTRWLKWVLFLNKRRMYLEIAEIIYRQHKSMLNARNYAKETPLHCAASAGNLHMVSLLVEFARKEGPQKLEQVLRARNKEGETALHEACRSSYRDVREIDPEGPQNLIKKVLWAINKVGRIALFEEARSSYSGIVKELLRADEIVACLEDENGISPLYWAVAAGCLDVVQQLIAAEHPPSYAGPDKQNALHAAVMRQEENITRVILEWKRSLATETDIAGNTPLHYATLIGNIYAVKKLLLKDTGSAYKANLSGSFPVHLAAQAGKIKVIKELLSKCPDVGELLDKEKRNFLHVAVKKKRKRVIALVCQVGINAKVINAKDKDGNTPLHLAVISSDSEIFDLLFQNKKVNPNIINGVGLTPLDISASLQDHQLKYSLIPQYIIYHALLNCGAFQNPCQPDLSKKVNNLVKARADCPNRTEGNEMCNDVGDGIEKELTKYENISKSLTTGAVLVASATFAAIFTVSGVYDDTRGNDTLGPTNLNTRNIFWAFVVADVVAFICAIVSTIWLLYAALSNFHPKYRKIYFQMCTPLLYGAFYLFILAFGLGGYIAIEHHSDILADFILLFMALAFILSVYFTPIFIPPIIQRRFL